MSLAVISRRLPPGVLSSASVALRLWHVSVPRLFRKSNRFYLHWLHHFRRVHLVLHHQPKTKRPAPVGRHKITYVPEITFNWWWAWRWRWGWGGGVPEGKTSVVVVYASVSQVESKHCFNMKPPGSIRMFSKKWLMNVPRAGGMVH